MKINKRLVIFMIIAMTLISGCSSMARMRRKENQRRKETEKQIEEKQKEEEKQYNEAVDQHWKNQDRSTRKMMKQTADKSIDFQNSKKQFFLKKLFVWKKKHKVKKTKTNQPK